MAAMFLTIPTLMTCTRIVATPLIVGVFYAPFDAATRNLVATRSEEHTSELQSQSNLGCRLLLEKKRPHWLALPSICSYPGRRGGHFRHPLAHCLACYLREAPRCLHT